eukprot:4147480-Alexandrium_andersonii.AAC.1
MGAAVVCLQTLQHDLAGVDEQTRFEHLVHYLKPEAPDAAARQADADLQADSDAAEAWRALAEARWR